MAEVARRISQTAIAANKGLVVLKSAMKITHKATACAGYLVVTLAIIAPQFGWCWDVNEALLKACYEGSVPRIEMLIKEGANVNFQERLGDGSKRWTPVMKAAWLNKKDAVDFLIRQGANVNAADREGKTPLWWAIYQNREVGGVVKLLCENGANANMAAMGATHATPLFFAADKGLPDVAAILLKHGANPNAQNSVQQTPLMFASKAGKFEVVKLLVENGANPGIRDRWGKTAIDYATNDQVGLFLRKSTR